MENLNKSKVPILWLFTAMFMFYLIPSNAQQLHLFQHETFVLEQDTLPYRILYPANFNPAKKYPLVLFLHGAGERGSDNEKQLTHGGAFFANDENRMAFPAIVVFPQCQADMYWAKIETVPRPDGKRDFLFHPDSDATEPMKLLMAFTDSLIHKTFIDTERIYLGGLSMGGMGTFELLYRKPGVFAAAFPICGGGNPHFLPLSGEKSSIWAFHGDSDGVVKPEYSVQMVNALQDAGFDAKLTIYEGVGHNAWDEVFKEPDLLHWLFGRRKSKMK